jgi:hypothetical protein
VKGNKNGSFYTKLPERYIRNSSSQITVDDDFLEAAKAQTNQRIRVLKNILEQYHTNTVEPYFKSNLISKYHMNFSSTLNQQRKVITIRRSATKSAVRKEGSKCVSFQQEVAKAKQKCIQSIDLF